MILTSVVLIILTYAINICNNSGISMARNKESAFPAGLSVRYDIVQVVLAHAGVSVKLPSARQLAEKFGISQRTVAAELAHLVEEGWIVGRHGIGYFSNPEKRGWYMGKPRRIVGLGWGDTKAISYDYNEFAIMSHAGMELAREAAYPRPLFVNSFNAEVAEAELRNSGLDAIVWGPATPKWQGILQHVHAAGLPVITLLAKIGGLPCIALDSFGAGRRLAEMIDWSHPGAVLWCNNREQFSRAIFEGFQSVMPDPSRFQYFGDPARMLEELERQIAAGKPPAVLYGRWEEVRNIYSRYGLAVEEVTQFISDWSFVAAHPDFHGICHRHPFGQYGEAVTATLRCLWAKQPVEDRILDWEIIKQ